MVRIEWSSASGLVRLSLECPPPIKSWRVPNPGPTTPHPGNVRAQVELYQHPDNDDGSDSESSHSREPQPCRVEWGTLSSLLPRLLNPRGWYRLPTGRLTEGEFGFRLEIEPNEKAHQVASLFMQELLKAAPRRVAPGTLHEVTT